MTSEVWEMMNRNGKVPWNAIMDFHVEEYKFLSNFYETPVFYDGLNYGSNEAAFQAQECITEEEKFSFTEYSPDICWGADTRTGQGENHLGEIYVKGKL